MSDTPTSMGNLHTGLRIAPPPTTVASPTVGIVFFKGKGLLSALVRWQTRGKFSHVGVVFPDDTFFEAWCGSGKKLWRNGGVIKKPCWKPDPDVIVVPIPMEPAGAAAARAYAESQVGKRYDFRSAARFLTRIKPSSNDKFFCSELVMNIFKAGGLNLLHAPASVVSPAVLWFAPAIGENL